MVEYTETVYNPDRLIAGDYTRLLSTPVTILSGQVLARGSVLGMITSSGKFILSLSAASDGSESVKYVLAEDVDASGGDVNTVAYKRGDFYEGALTIGTGHTADSIRDSFPNGLIQLIPGTAP